MSRTGEEPKPRWQQVPFPVRERTAALLGARVARAERAFGGYAPTPTFRLLLNDGRRAFFKGINHESNSFMRGALVREERVYEWLGDLISPWAPAYYGSLRLGDWHVLLLEDLGPSTVPPWGAHKARAALRAYAEFHQRTYTQKIPRWLPRAGAWAGFGHGWERLLGTSDGKASLAALAGERATEASAWLDACMPRLDVAAHAYTRTPPPYALLHLDTRSDNIRVHPGTAVPLRIFDWPFACAGPPELDLMAFAQSVTCEGGPAPETLTRWYAEVHPVRERVLLNCAAAVSGFFAGRAWQPPVEGLPRLRSIQRRQLRASLAWAARLLDLPEPAWLEAVPG